MYSTHKKKKEKKTQGVCFLCTRNCHTVTLETAGASAADGHTSSSTPASVKICEADD